MSLGFPGVLNPSPVLAANVLGGSVVAFPECLWKDAKAMPGICAIPPRCPPYPLPSQDPQFGLGRGWEGSATQFIQGTPPKGLVASAWALPIAQSHLRVQISCSGTKPILNVCWKPQVGTPWKQNQKLKAVRLGESWIWLELHCSGHFLPKSQRKASLVCATLAHCGAENALSDGVPHWQFLAFPVAVEQARGDSE